MNIMQAELNAAKTGSRLNFTGRPQEQFALAPAGKRIGNWKWAWWCVLWLAPLLLHGQSYSIPWYKVSGGGGTSSGGGYSVSATIGQPDASGALTGGNYSLTGGFWALYAVQTPGAPLLTITYAGNQALVSWSPSLTGWTLQTNANPATPTWGNYLGPILNNSATFSPPRGNVFFRLKQ